MDNNKVFKDRDLIGICQYLMTYCETYICATTTVSTEHASSLHAFLPTLLTYIFGSPTVRGWLQTETRPDQDDAMRQLLDPKGFFLASLIKLGTRSEYSYDMALDKFSDDIRRALTAGAIEYLPRVYDNCAFLDVSKVTKSLDLRSSATRQSSIFPRPSKGEFRIRFNMIQFYLYYMVSVATWAPLTPSQSNPSSNPYNSSIKPPYPTPNPTYSRPPISSASATTSTSASSSATNTLPYLLHGQLRPTSAGIYPGLIKLYMRVYIPCVLNDAAVYTNGIGTFFLDTLIELWIRTVWISSSQKLSLDFTQYLATFLKYIVSGDLRRCATFRNHSVTSSSLTPYTDVYLSIKDELYLLLSRLSLNWRKQDDYIWILNLWTIWAAPWRLGNVPITMGQHGKAPNGMDLLKGESTASPLDEGWAYFMLENAWYYLSLIDSFLQRISTFAYPDIPPPPTTFAPPSSNANSAKGYGNASPPLARPMYSTTPTQPSVPNPTAPRPATPLDGSSLYGELNIFNQLVNIWKSKGLIDFLASIEDGLGIVADESALPANTTKPSFSSFLHTTQHRLNSTLSFSPSMNQHQQQQHDRDTLASLSRTCCISDGSDTSAVKQLLQSLQDRILSISPVNAQQWKPSNIYSTSRQRRSEYLVKALESLETAIDKRLNAGEKGLISGATSWRNAMLGQRKETGGSRSSAEVSSLSSMAVEVSTLLTLPLPDRSRTMVNANNPISLPTATPASHLTNHVSTETSPPSASSSPSSTAPKPEKHERTWTRRRHRPVIKACGPRAEEVVRTYESKLLISWIVPFDRSVNSVYRRWFWHSRLPERISFRWFAAPVNLVYFVLLLTSVYIYSLW